jgi:PRTRC genetic system protein B
MGFALIFQEHRKTPLNPFGGNGSSVVITRHPLFVSEDGRQQHIGAGALLSNADLIDLRHALDQGITSSGGWITDDLLYLSESGMAWYVPSAKRPMYFRLGGKSFRHTVIWPTLVMQYHTAKDFRIAACAGRGKPKPNTKLYHAPLFNVYADGRLCLGSASGAKTLDEKGRNAWNEAVFDSNFSHTNHSGLLRSSRSKEVTDRDYLRVIKEKARSGTPFLAKDMAPLGRQLKDWIIVP